MNAKNLDDLVKLGAIRCEKRLKWSEFKKLVEDKLQGKDIDIEFILFDVDYEILWITVNSKQRLMIEG